jgi:hypothetical protein
MKRNLRILRILPAGEIYVDVFFGVAGNSPFLVRERLRGCVSCVGCVWQPSGRSREALAHLPNFRSCRCASTCAPTALCKPICGSGECGTAAISTVLRACARVLGGKQRQRRNFWCPEYVGLAIYADRAAVRSGDGEAAEVCGMKNEAGPIPRAVRRGA